MERYNSVEVEPELELRLGRGRCSSSPPPCVADVNRRNGIADLPSSDDRLGQITIFYDGHVSVCNITDFQARAIMEMAKKEMSRSLELNNGKQEEEKESPLPTETTTVESQLLNPGLSMKRSLQRFLQKRKTRMADHLSYPYGFTQKPLQLFSSS